jgi:lysozyme family protein
VADFFKAIDYVLANEGGYVNNPADPGGETNFGISKRAYPHLDIKSLTREDAATIYQRDYWKFDELASQRVATKLFDACVNMGPTQAVRLLQISLSGIQAGPIIADGKFGAETVAHVNAADEEKLMDEFKARLAKFYAVDQVQREGGAAFLLGWLRRAVKG